MLKTTPTLNVNPLKNSTAGPDFHNNSTLPIKKPNFVNIKAIKMAAGIYRTNISCLVSGPQGEGTESKLIQYWSNGTRTLRERTYHLSDYANQPKPTPTANTKTPHTLL